MATKIINRGMLGLVAMAVSSIVCPGVAVAQWEIIDAITAEDAAPFDFFGLSVAISGDYAIVGAPYEDDYEQGSAYIFKRSNPPDTDPGLPLSSNSSWALQKKVTAFDAHFSSDLGGRFGSSVAISDDYAIVGAPGKYSDSGAAYVFDLSGASSYGIYSQKKLVPEDVLSYDEFGSSVAISGNTAIVGAPDHSSNQGAAYVFDLDDPTDTYEDNLFDDGTGNPLTVIYPEQKLVPEDVSPNDHFGLSVAISGNTAIVGAPDYDGHSSDQGAAYVFEGYEEGWFIPREKITAFDAAKGDHFGTSVAISGDTTIVGAPLGHSDTGAAYVFDLSGASSYATYSSPIKLVADSDEASPYDYFGFSVSISGDIAIVGAPYHKPLSDDELLDGVRTGSAFVFDLSGVTFEEGVSGELLVMDPQLSTASDAAAGDFFGGSVAISGHAVIVGAPKYEWSRGAAYTFIIPEPGTMALLAIGTLAVCRRRRR